MRTHRRARPRPHVGSGQVVPCALLGQGALGLQAGRQPRSEASSDARIRLHQGGSLWFYYLYVQMHTGTDLLEGRGQENE